ncbi:MAG TPA: hypothetical protein VGZ68_05620 [Acidimicrobiales bacterium]|jgi:alkanesulfonate monooxygenase SsuD/methylene tetrahydromethanopterin reductase-like flavin-dependent oxidoreductase (luciferase family)|nr:hypothetical protein [Acidimicrobiales bacterium]
MELVHLAATASRRDEALRVFLDHLILFECTDAETVLVVASLGDRVTTDLGVWLSVTSAYSAQLAARDVATLSALVPLRHVVIDASERAEDHADVVRALLTNDEVNFTNGVATIRGAYNRPAPPTSVSVWSHDEDRLRNGDEVLTRRSVEESDVGELTYFA